MIKVFNCKIDVDFTALIIFVQPLPFNSYCSYKGNYNQLVFVCKYLICKIGVNIQTVKSLPSLLT